MKTDEKIIERVLAGDISKFEMLIEKYQTQVFYVAMNISRNKDTAEDIVQDAFIKAFDKLQTLNERAHFFPWLKRITINLALNNYDKNKRIVDVEVEDSEVSFFDRLPDDSDPESIMINDELKRYVRLYVDALPERLRRVIIMREVEDLSYEEISEILKIPLGTVRSRLFNARQVVKDRLIKQGLTDSLVSRTAN